MAGGHLPSFEQTSSPKSCVIPTSGLDNFLASHALATTHMYLQSFEKRASVVLAFGWTTINLRPGLHLSKRGSILLGALVMKSTDTVARLAGSWLVAAFAL